MPEKKIARLITVFSKPEVQHLFDNARIKFRQKGLEIRVAPKKLEYGRILIIIPRHVGIAVQRNLLRRRLKSIFYQQQLYQKKYDYIILTQKPAAAISFDELKTILVGIHENS